MTGIRQVYNATTGETTFEEYEIAEIQPTPEQIIAEFTQYLQDRLDTKAREHMYDDVKSLCTYLPDDPNPIYAAEGALGRIWRSDTWTVSTAVMTAVMTAVQQGTRGMPTIAEIESLLMPLKWTGEP